MPLCTALRCLLALLGVIFNRAQATSISEEVGAETGSSGGFRGFHELEREGRFVREGFLTPAGLEGGGGTGCLGGDDAEHHLFFGGGRITSQSSEDEEAILQNQFAALTIALNQISFRKP